MKTGRFDGSLRSDYFQRGWVAFGRLPTDRPTRHVGRVVEQAVDPCRHEPTNLLFGLALQVAREEGVFRSESPDVNLQTSRVRVRDDRGGLSELSTLPSWDHEVFRQANRIGVGLDVPKPIGRDEFATSVVVVDEEHDRKGGPFSELLTSDRLEALKEHPFRVLLLAMPPQGLEQPRLQREANRPEIRRVLRLWIDADRAGAILIHPVEHRQDLFQGRNLEPAVVDDVAGPDLRKPLFGAQGLQLPQGEVLDEPARYRPAIDRLRGLAPGELRTARNVGRTRDLVLVACDRFLSLVHTTSGSTKSAPCSIASSYDASVCSGR